jgi:hypothetical protein
METNTKKGGGKLHHSGSHGDDRKAITARNKARRAARYTRWVSTRQTDAVRARVAAAHKARRTAASRKNP